MSTPEPVFGITPPPKLRSRKFWMALVTALVIVLNEGLGLAIPREAALALAGVIIAYILGESVVDAAH